ncbi:MAG: sigma-70 family RNA polymerase sigma factor [Cyclobacteriaceae bacterium]
MHYLSFLLSSRICTGNYKDLSKVEATNLTLSIGTPFVKVTVVAKVCRALEINTSLDAYLFGAAKFRILTYIRSERVRKEYAAHFAIFSSERLDNSNEELMNLKDLQHSIDTSISELPEKCRSAFRMSRIENEPIPRIAERMNISPRTVENYLTRALKHLRNSLTEYLTIFILCLMRLMAGDA